MNRHTNKQCKQIIAFYYQIACFVKKVHRELLLFYGEFNRPTGAVIMTKFRPKFTLLNIQPSTRLRRVRTEEDIAAILASVNDGHQLSIRRLSQRLGPCYSIKWKILRKDFKI